MPHIRKQLAAAIAALGALGITTPGASADFGLGVPVGTVASPIGNPVGGVAPCGRVTPEGQGGTGSSEQQICQGAGLVFVGPADAQIVSVIGPTIIGPTAVGNVAVSAGDVAIGN